MFWPFFALISIVIFWLSLFVLLTKWPRVGNMSISRHAAANKQAYLFFTVVQVVVGILTYVFMAKWFISHFNLSRAFLVVYTITALLQVSSALLPDTIRGTKSTIHLHLANLMALGMLLSSIYLSFAPSVTGFPRLVSVLTSVYLLSSALMIIGKRGKPELLRNYLMLQVAYVVIFQISVLVITFFEK